MKTITLILLIATSVMAETYYVRYDKATGKQIAFATDFPIDQVDILPNGNDFRSMPDLSIIQRVGVTTIDPTGKTNISQFANFVPVSAINLSCSVKKTPQWVSLTNDIAGYGPLLDSVTNRIAQEPAGAGKAADQDLKNLIKHLQQEIKDLKVIIGKNMQVEP